MANQNLTLLLVEDNRGDAILFRRALKRETDQADIIHAESGEAAVEALLDESQHFDLVFLDLNLPGMSGQDVLKHLKSIITLRSVPVVVLSSSSATQDINESYANFASVYLVKPHDPDGYEKLAKFIVECWFGMVQLPRAHRAIG